MMTSPRKGVTKMFSFYSSLYVFFLPSVSLKWVLKGSRTLSTRSTSLSLHGRCTDVDGRPESEAEEALQAGRQAAATWHQAEFSG